MFTIYDGRKEFYQWDADRKVIVDDNSITQVHFCNRTDECSLVTEVYELDGKRVADVPNILLQTAWRINVYAYDSNYTKHSDVFCVVARSKPANYIYTETEVLNYNTLLERVNAVEENVGQIVDEYLKENPIDVDLTGYATEKYVDDAVANIEVDVDLSGYATEKYVDDAVADVDVDLTGYATEEYVNNAIANVPSATGGECCVHVGPEAPTKDYQTLWVDTDADAPEFALKSDIPDVSKYQTAAQVEAAITAALNEIGVAEEGAY